MSAVIVRVAQKEFSWTAELLALIQVSFAYMRGVVDPPSYAERLTVQALETKIQREHLILAEANRTIDGCMFADPRRDHLYL